MMDEVSGVMRHAARVAILPRFRSLQKGEVSEKSPGELVSVADREAEQIIEPLLKSLMPGSRVIGEEAASEAPALLGAVGEGDVWLVDPLDGTANFVAGSPDFSVMVALLKRGETVAAWLFDPLRDQMATASRGAGAFINEGRIQTESASLPAASCRGSVLSRFLPDALREQVAANASHLAAVLPGARCAGVDYPAVATGAQHFVMFWRLFPWDHAAGALFVTEAGGFVARLDGSAYHPADSRPGLLAAQNRDIWQTVKDTLFDVEPLNE